MKAGALILMALASVVLISTSAFSQGSTGGSIGKQGKSAAGSDSAPSVKPPLKRVAARPASYPPRAKSSGCSRYVGVWTFEVPGTEYNVTIATNGAAQSDNGYAGKWRCSGRVLAFTWHTGGTEQYSLLDDGSLSRIGGSNPELVVTATKQ